MEVETPTSAPSSARPDEPDPRSRLQHVLSVEPRGEASSNDAASVTAPASPANGTADANRDDEAASSADTPGPGSEMPQYTANATTTRRNANGSVSSVYSGNKIRHLKKEDGVPLWRQDIQYEFLRAVFTDDKPVFHKVSDGTSGHCFADIYLDAMAKSSKCSKILKDKLLTERPQAINMAMVCLLVNVGRMNTTLNFFPEMRAQLRTYHSIPSLQAHQDPSAYKQLQDAPRLKSILKGATEDIEQPNTLDAIMAATIPRTNPVSLIFVLAQYAPRVSAMHFDVPRDFFDLVMKPELSSKSRANAFLWLMWWYLESNFTKEDALNNPYGPGRASKEEPDELPIKCPQFEYLSKEQAALENVDTESEKEFGEMKRLERIAILQNDLTPAAGGNKRGGRKSAAYANSPAFNLHSDDAMSTQDSPAPSHRARGGKRKFAAVHDDGESLRSSLAGIKHDPADDSDRTRSASPPASKSGMRINTLLHDSGHASSPSHSHTTKGRGRGNWRRDPGIKRTYNRADKNAADAAPRADSPAGGSSPIVGPHGFYLPLNGAEPSHKRSRPLTNHQQAVEKYRKRRVEYILDRRLRDKLEEARGRRERDGLFLRAWMRCQDLGSDYDSDEEALAHPAHVIERTGKAAGTTPLLAGLYPRPWEQASKRPEENDVEVDDDWGEEAGSLASALRRWERRVERREKGLPVVRREKRRREERLAELDAELDAEPLMLDEPAPKKKRVVKRKPKKKAPAVKVAEEAAVIPSSPARDEDETVVDADETIVDETIVDDTIVDADDPVIDETIVDETVGDLDDTVADETIVDDTVMDADDGGDHDETMDVDGDEDGGDDDDHTGDDDAVGKARSDGKAQEYDMADASEEEPADEE